MGRGGTPGGPARPATFGTAGEPGRNRNLNPVVGLNVDIENLSFVEAAGVQLSQEFELGGKRQARIRAAEAELRAAELGFAQVRRELQAEAKARFARLLFAQAQEDVRREGADLAEGQAELGRGRLRLGDVAGVEVVQLETDAERRRAEVEDAVGTRRSEAAALAALLGRSPEPDLQAAGTLGRPTPALEPAALRADARLSRPDLAAARARVETRLAEIRVEETRGVANLTGSVGITRQRTFIDEDAFEPPGIIEHVDDRDWVLGLGLEMPLPIFDTNQGNIERARALVEAARAEADVLERAIDTEIGDAFERLLAARRVRERLVAHALPRARRAFEIAEEAYRLGARSVLDLLQARQAFLDVRTAALEAARDEEQALIDLETAVGRDLAAPATEVTP